MLHGTAIVRASTYPANTKCVVCDGPMLHGAQPLVLFFCWHSAHLACIAPQAVRRAPALPFAPALETTTAADARESEAWLSEDPSEDAPLQLAAGQQQPFAATIAAQSRARAQRHAMFRAKQLSLLPFARTGCPVCAENRAYCLEA